MSKAIITESLLVDIADAIRGKNGSSDTYTPSEMATAVENISTGITPTGTKSISITENGTTAEDVTNYASAEITVNVSSSPSLGTKSITTNGTYNASSDSLDGYSQVTVAVPASEVDSGTKSISITTNGTTTENVVGYASAEITVNVGSSGYNVNDIATNTEPSGTITLDTATTIKTSAFEQKPITNVYAPVATVLYPNAFRYCTSLVKAYFPAVTSLRWGNTYTFQESSVQQLSMPALADIIPPNFAQAATSLTTIDIGKATQINANSFNYCSSLTTIIIRKSSALVALANVNGLGNTPFKSGGTGGTIYVPQAIYNELGTASSLDYQSATNWSTIHGYGTITWAVLEGSAYESTAWLTI